MDRTGRDGDRSAGHSLDETLPSVDETLPSGDHGPSPLTRSTGGVRGVEVPVERGTVIGRYTVIERIGSGTMGVVLLAFDATLDRKIAIKLVQLDETGSTSGRQRLLREAQAMAKLQHPNVVTVFEVGTFEDRVFLAMEYVAGSTLHDWIEQPNRTHKEIVDAFVAAGYGLAAAHHAGIVHRDFKPTNVLIGKEGRVRVADFGLATAPADAAPPPVAVSRDSDPGPLGMTKTGAVLGTPAYMSPEQHRGEVASARADQYSFCVALYEALYKELPFEGATFLVYHDNVLAGRVREAPRNRDVPLRTRRVLLRGLALAPGDRYPDMDALLIALANDPAASRRRFALIGGSSIFACAVVLVLARSSGTDDPCAAAAQPLAELWNASQRRALEESFRASGSPGAASTFKRVATVLDERASALRVARREACVATAVRREQSPELLDRRIQCVDQRAAATSALITVLTENRDAETMMNGLKALMSLPPVEACADRAALLSEVPPPPAAIRTQVDALARRLDRVEAMADAGLYTKALEELAQIVPEADKLAHAPLSARGHFLAAESHIKLEHNQQGVAELRRAGELAAVAHDDKLVAQSWTSLFATVGYRLGKYDEAAGIEQVAAAAVVRAGNDPSLVGGLENARGVIALGRDQYGPAAEHFKAAATNFEKAGRSYQSAMASNLNNAGTALTWDSKFDEARTVLEKTLALRTEMLGPDHPDVGYGHYGLGVLFDQIGKPEQALEQFQKSATISAKAYPPDSAHIAKDLVSVGLVLGQLERAEEALDHQKRALAIFELHPEDNRQYMSQSLSNLGFAYMTAKRPKDAVETFQRGLVVAQAEHGAESEQVASVLSGLLGASDLAGDHERAKEYGVRALAIREKNLGPKHEQVARVLGDLANNANERHQPREAMQLIDRALAIIEKPGAPPLAVRFVMRQIRATAELALGRGADALADARIARDGLLASGQPIGAAEVRLTVADALWMQGGANRREAITEVKAAIDTLQAEKKPNAELLAKAHAWLATHPQR